ncbi:SDR family NAD(P)-dependent oxidoreductase [Pontiella agarivorans]|uniref:SDR family NAD(P)-dependent oxidoreductase n=1 Tax=Pontiella agarivorans TaxID=3038953 RepID=A0ABU5MSW9_9BACT|nr:SDR family NAD(P)-dependent oxidoreductase [Pontiella agarivorans]MDZ8117181.1 SDR family NAD(P)-dependent oxidoreductase [Pontiella agarivorans]
MKAAQVKQRTVLVTGCSSGIGEATAYFLRDQGWTVFPTARKADDLQTLRNAGFDALELDLGSSESVQSCVHTLLEKVPEGLGGLVNNAGMAMPGAVEDLSRDALRRQFEVNVFGLQELTNGLIPTFRAQEWGRIVTVSSIYGVIAAPMVGNYCASKFAVEALADAQRVELSGSGISLSLIEPGPIVSAFRRNAAAALEENVISDDVRYAENYRKEAARRKKQYKKVDFINRPPEDVAKKVFHALESSRPKRRYVITLPAYLGAFMARFVPTALVDRVMARELPR